MINAIDLKEPVIYICKSDRKSKKPTKWRFRALSHKEELFLQKMRINQYKSDDFDEKFADEADIYLHIALDGAENFNGKFVRDDSSECVYGDIKPWTDETLTSIPIKIRDELITFVIQGYSNLSEEELKN